MGKEISDVIINNPKVIKEPSLGLFKKGLKGAKIARILRKGKVLILELSSGKSLVIHLRMTGQLVLRLPFSTSPEREKRVEGLVYPGNAKNSRVSFRLSDNKILDYNDSRILGELRLLDNWRDLKFIRELGPEPFDLTLDEFKKMLSKKKTKIKPLLLDQKFMSGVGNLYAAEALFKSRIHPLRQASGLSNKEKENLFSAIKEILSDAIKHKGSSVDQYVTLTGEKGGYVSYHKVYDREDKPCYVCKALIKRIALAGRGTYFCARCQK